MQSLHQSAEPIRFYCYAAAYLNTLWQQDRHCGRAVVVWTHFRTWSAKLDEIRACIWKWGGRQCVTNAHITPMSEDVVADAMQAAVRRLTEAARRPGG